MRQHRTNWRTTLRRRWISTPTTPTQCWRAAAYHASGRADSAHSDLAALDRMQLDDLLQATVDALLEQIAAP